jgi:hypothetical protein
LIHTIPIVDAKSFFAVKDVQPEFSWWYVDVLDAAGNGCVCIFSQGLPFLPDSIVDRPKRFSLNCVLYKGGKECFYLLQEFPESDVVLEHTRTNTGSVEVWRIGPHRFERRIIECADGEDGSNIQCSIELDSSDGSMAHHIQGSIQLSGSLIQRIQGVQTPSIKDHQWTPVTTQCIARVNLITQDDEFSMEGSAYHDSNISNVPLNRLNIGSWWWTRCSFAHRTWIVYLVTPLDDETDPIYMVASVNTLGRWTSHAVQSIDTIQPKRSIYGLSLPSAWRIELQEGPSITVQVDSWLDDSPFYQRVLVRMSVGSEESNGYLEHVVPPKLDIAWQQPFIRMKTHFQDQQGSFFSPLFTGPATTRWHRQFSQCLPF